MRILSPLNIPDLAIEDPLLTASMPPSVTAATGMDALTHAIEGYLSKRQQLLTNSLAIPAIRLITRNLSIAWANGDDLEARSNMMAGQLLAAMTFTNASTALVHGMARTLGIFFHIPHGLSNAVLLPHVMEFTLPAAPRKFAEIAEAMGENITGLSLKDQAKQAQIAVKQLTDELEIPNLSDLGVKEDDLQAMAKDVLSITPGTPAFNPRKANVNDIVYIYRKAL